MPRDLVLGNGNLLVCLDRDLFLRDLYWPYVGLYNHLSGHKVRFGAWADGKFAWVDETWDRDLNYRPHSLVSDCHLRNDRLELSLSVSDVVDYQTDAFLRRITVRNLTGRPRHVRIFFAADTMICENDIGDTTYYDPYGDAVVHYKRNNYLLIGGQNPETGDGLYGFACGMKNVPGSEGTWRDCEDGDLSGNLIAQGSVDSAISVAAAVPAGGEATLHLWILVGETRERVLEMLAALRAETVDAVFDRTERYWRSWVQRGLSPTRAHPLATRERYLTVLPSRVQSLFRRSLLIMRTQIDNRGAVLAANDSDIMQTNRAHYSYMWPRDGALVAHSLDAAGYDSLTRQFFLFCRDILPRDRAAFYHKYGPDGSVGSSWHAFLAPDGGPELPLQEDETALVVWALWHHYTRHRDFDFLESMYRTLARPCADFLLDYRDPATGLPKPSWDLWEERRGIHTYTVCTVIAALDAAMQMALLVGDVTRAELDGAGVASVRHALLTHLWSPYYGRFARRLEVWGDGTVHPDMTQDAALHALHIFDVLPLDDPRLQETMRQVNDRLWVRAGIGGMARYEGDYYARVSDDLRDVPGNPWIICTLWLAQWQIKNAKTLAELDAPCNLLEWANLTALPSGVLPEQIHPYEFTPMTVAPLTWSHSEVVETVYLFLEKYAALKAAEASASGTAEASSPPPSATPAPVATSVVAPKEDVVEQPAVPPAAAPADEATPTPARKRRR